MKNIAYLVCVSSLVMALAAQAQDKPDASAAPEGGKDYVILKVGGEEVKKSQVEDAWKDAGKYIFQGKDVPAFDSMDQKMKDKFLREFASERALYQEAQKEGIENSPETQATLEKLKRQVIIQELLKEKTQDAVTDDKLKKSYDDHIKAAVEANGGHDEIQARHIVVKTKEEADAIEKKLKGGASFEKLAKEKSDDKDTAAQGGELGWFSPEKISPDFPAQMLKLKKGGISEPIKIDSSWQIIKLEDWRALPPPPFSDVKDSIKQEVGNKAVSDYVKGLMKDVKLTKLDAKGDETPLDKDDSAPDKGDKDAPADQ